MAKIKLNNIFLRPKKHAHKLEERDTFCRTCGEFILEGICFYNNVCEVCRYTIEDSDKYCANCGILTGEISGEEFYDKGKKITKSEFTTFKKL